MCPSSEKPSIKSRSFRESYYLMFQRFFGRWYYQLNFGSNLNIVSLLCLSMAVCFITSSLFCGSIIIYMTNSVSRILNILYRHLKIMILQITILTQLYVRVRNLLKYEKHWHDHITALKVSGFDP